MDFHLNLFTSGFCYLIIYQDKLKNTQSWLN